MFSLFLEGLKSPGCCWERITLYTQRGYGGRTDGNTKYDWDHISRKNGLRLYSFDALRRYILCSGYYARLCTR